MKPRTSLSLSSPSPLSSRALGRRIECDRDRLRVRWTTGGEASRLRLRWGSGEVDGEVNGEMEVSGEGGALEITVSCASATASVP